MKTFILFFAILPTFVFADVTSNLKFGMRNEQVLELQSFLIDNGYISKESKTGYFGAKTLIGVKKYQIAYKLPSTGYVGPMTRLAMNSSKVIVATTTVTTETPKVTTVEIPKVEPVAQATPKVYNIVIMEEVTPTYTLGTPTRVNKVNGDGDHYSYVELPISFNPEIVKVGNVVTIEGLISNDQGVQSAGNEFAFAPTSPVNQVMNLGDVYGTFDYTFTLKDNKGVVTYTQNNNIVIEK